MAICRVKLGLVLIHLAPIDKARALYSGDLKFRVGSFVLNLRFKADFADTFIFRALFYCVTYILLFYYMTNPVSGKLPCICILTF